MYQDVQNTYSQAQAVTVTAVSTNKINAGAANRDVGHGRAVELVVQCIEAADAVGAATLQVQLQDSADGNSFATVVETPAIGKAALLAGTEVLRIALPTGLRQYTQLNYVVATGPLTAGKFTAFLTLDRQANRPMPRGYHFS